MLAKAGADVAIILDRTEDETEGYHADDTLFGLEELTEFARIFAQNDLMQKNQGTPQLGLELAFLQCIELHRGAQSGQPTRCVCNCGCPCSPGFSGAVTANICTGTTHSFISNCAACSTGYPISTIRTKSYIAPAQPRAVPMKEETIEDLSTLDDMSFHDEGDEEFAHDISAGSNGDMSSPREESNSPMLTLTQVLDSWERVKKASQREKSDRNKDICIPE